MDPGKDFHELGVPVVDDGGCHAEHDLLGHRCGPGGKESFFHSASVFGSVHHGCEFIEQVVRVVWAGSGFGVVLY